MNKAHRYFNLIKSITIVLLFSIVFSACTSQPESSGQARLKTHKVLPNHIIPQAKIDEILSLKKGKRPEPSDYMSSEQISAHLALFDEGAVRFTSRQGVYEYGTLGPDGGFVMPKKLFSQLIEQSDGNMRIIENKLGLEQGYLTNTDTAIYYIPRNEIVNLRLPSGNETGANKNWIPGGYTSGGIPEAVMDFSNQPQAFEIKLK